MTGLAKLVGIFAGLSAFVITWVIGQPMAVPQMACVLDCPRLAAASTGGDGATQRLPWRTGHSWQESP